MVDVVINGFCLKRLSLRHVTQLTYFHSQGNKSQFSLFHILLTTSIYCIVYNKHTYYCYLLPHSSD